MYQGNMEQITKQQVEKIAELSHFELTEKEIEKFSSDLKDILGFVELLNEVDTTGIEATSQIIPISNVMRKDKGIKHDAVDDIIRQFPNKEERFLKVKGVLYNEE